LLLSFFYFNNKVFFSEENRSRSDVPPIESDEDTDRKFFSKCYYSHSVVRLGVSASSAECKPFSNQTKDDISIGKSIP
jgi:hypothetical protein